MSSRRARRCISRRAPSHIGRNRDAERCSNSEWFFNMFHKNRRFLSCLFWRGWQDLKWMSCRFIPWHAMRQGSSRLLFPQRFFLQAPIYCSSGDWLLVPGDVGHVVAIYSSGLVTKKLYFQVWKRVYRYRFRVPSELAIFGDELEPWRVMIMVDWWNGHTSFLARVIYFLKRFAGVFENCCVFFFFRSSFPLFSKELQ